jgi:hypothetical protein
MRDNGIRVINAWQEATSGCFRSVSGLFTRVRPVCGGLQGEPGRVLSFQHPTLSR